MDDKEDILKVVRAIHDTSTGSVVAVAGAGASALEWLLGTTGSSRTILEALAPNSPKAMADFIGYMPEQFVSDQTALNMAAAAYRRGAQLREDEGVPVVGIGCTATVATDRPKRGEHRCHIAAWWPTGASSSYLELTKGLRDRSGEDDLVSRLLLRVLAKTSGVDDPVALPLAAGEQVVEDGWSFTDVLSATVAGHVRTAVVPPRRSRCSRPADSARDPFRLFQSAA